MGFKYRGYNSVMQGSTLITEKATEDDVETGIVNYLDSADDIVACQRCQNMLGLGPGAQAGR